MFYPYSTQLQTAVTSFSKGNFSLWFNKLVPLNNERNCKACNKQGNDKEAVQYYESFYNELKKNNPALKGLLDAKQKRQREFCEFYENVGYKIINYQAELKSPLITGIGQTHPNEVGMVFDHAMGIPFIPASSVKGIVRFAHIIKLIKSEDQSYIESDKDGEYINESNLGTNIPDIFGGDADIIENDKKKTKKWVGKVIFLDAYPVTVPDLHVDIMNPHYGDYYSDENGKTPPADYLDPTPIKFLTVKQGTKFIFRALVPKDSDLLEIVKTGFKNALKDEGVGAKTAVGYGRFEIQSSQKTIVSKPIAAKRKIWEKASLKYTPNNGLIEATFEGNKATTKDKELVPEKFQGKLFKEGKKKSISAKVEVETIGNSFRIVCIA